MSQRRSRERSNTVAESPTPPAPIHCEPGPLETSIQLTGAIDVRHAVQLRDRLLEALSSSSELRIGWQQVTELDVTAIQLLLAAERMARGRGLSVRYDGPLPESIATALTEAGFENFGSAEDNR